MSKDLPTKKNQATGTLANVDMIPTEIHDFIYSCCRYVDESSDGKIIYRWQRLLSLNGRIKHLSSKWTRGSAEELSRYLSSKFRTAVSPEQIEALARSWGWGPKYQCSYRTYSVADELNIPVSRLYGLINDGYRPGIYIPRGWREDDSKPIFFWTHENVREIERLLEIKAEERRSRCIADLL